MAKSNSGANSGTKKARAHGTDSSKKGWGGVLAFIACFAVCVSLLGVYLLHFQSQASSPLQPLSGAALDEFLKANDNGALVYFYLNDCSFCQKLAPDLEKAVRQIQAAEGKSAPAFGSVNADEEVEATKRFDLSRYPSVLWIRKGEVVNELKPTSRTVDKIVEFVSQVCEPAIVEFETRAEFEEAVPTLRETLHDGTSAVIAGFEGFPDTYGALEQVAHRFRGKAVFIYVKEAGDSEDGAALRSITNRADSDDAYTQLPVQLESVKKWVERVLKGLKQKTSPSAEKEEI